MWDHVVFVAYDGVLALQTALVEKPDLLLLDLRLPRMDGFEVARHIRAEPVLQGMVIWAVTGLARETDRLLSARAGCAAHFLKPVDPVELRALLSTLARPDGPTLSLV
jgi:CheY-like chemotaxis protein